jgi:hypothetical protein
MPSWTGMDDVVATLLKRWATGRYLRDYAEGVTWRPVELPVRAPSSNELLDRFDEAVRWAERFRRDSHTAGGAERLTVIQRVVKGRNLGENSLPARVRIESFEQLCSLLGTTRDVRTLDAIFTQTRSKVPTLAAWVIAHPLIAIDQHEIWDKLLATVAWISARSTTGLYLRQIDVEGVDTKFVDQHRKLLDQLLSAVLPDERIDANYAATDFARRFRFRPKPAYTRFRIFQSQPSIAAGLSEIMVRSEELAVLEIVCKTVFVIENEISYLAFPTVPDSLVIFGSGFDVITLRDLPWLHDKEIVYWGDVDTHGFDILSRLRAEFETVTSLLMDCDTLLAHRSQWGSEPSPTNRRLANLTVDEEALYRDLVEDRYGRAVRLEQERVRFSWLHESLMRWMLEPLA